MIYLILLSIPPFLLDGYPGIINESQLTIDVTVPFGTPVTNMITTFTTTGESVTVNGVIQTSGSLPSHNFESPVAYVVHAADASIAIYTVTVHPTGNVWTWMSGSNLINQYGIYSNIPGSRNAGISWLDASDNLWLFGGNGRVESGSNGYLNDLWKYHP
ncbi:MAG: hypothetical protein K0R49_1464 [Burkholderiales bacterium]|jgi:hypothetical protein|nr:hypothetical protein [Burkholderiales bacterium]